MTESYAKNTPEFLKESQELYGNSCVTLRVSVGKERGKDTVYLMPGREGAMIVERLQPGKLGGKVVMGGEGGLAETVEELIIDFEHPSGKRRSVASDSFPKDRIPQALKNLERMAAFINDYNLK